MWLARCLVMNGKARHAWELYLKMEGTQEPLAMLQPLTLTLTLTLTQEPFAMLQPLTLTLTLNPNP